MSTDQVRGHIQQIVDGILKQKGLTPTPLTDETRLLDGKLGVDSLDLAVIVTELQQVTGLDPFKGGFRNFRTVGELAQLYTAASQ